MLVHSEKSGININIAEGNTGEVKADPGQANHLASVGKLFTATVIGMLNDKGLLNFEDKIAQYLDAELMNKLHVYKDRDYSGDITIKHLLKQTSGLNDVFFHPQTETYVIGTFNDKSYTSKALRFMLMKVIKPLFKMSQA